jgi:NAD(P)-dependent dehydrogenase (short-subunit alcohol dehydrogenase family)
VITESVLVTGASTGIGEACALWLDRLGFQVFAGVRRDEDADNLANKSSVSLKPIKLDVTNPENVQAAVETIAKEADGALAGLVNNAGIVMAGPMEFVTIDDLRKQLEVNVVAQVALIQATLPQLRSGRGRIVNIGSVAGRFSAPFMGPYSASKFAIEAITDALRMELKPWGIHVAVVEPGNIATPIWRKSIDEGKQRRTEMPPDAEALYGKEIDMMIDFAEQQGRRGIPPDRVAKVVVHALTSQRPKTRYLVGNDAFAQAWMARLIPDRVRDWAVAKGLKALSPS